MIAAFGYHPSTLTHALGLVALGGLAAQLSALVWLHVEPTGLDPVRNAVSQYGISARPGGYRVQTLAMAVALAGAALAAAIAWRGRGVGFIVALLVAAAAARAAISWYPMDAPGSTRTSTGRAHGLLALVAFVSIADAGWRVSRLLQTAPGWSGLRDASTTWSIVMLVSLVLVVLTRAVPEGRRVFGLVERGFYIGAMGFLAATAGAFVFVR